VARNGTKGNMTTDQFPEIYVLRHGQTEWNLAGRHQGRLDSPLTETGRQQAQDQGQLLAEALAQPKTLHAYCSPQGRAMNTSCIALGSNGLVATPDERLCEIAFGDWQGLTFDEISERWPELTKYADQDMFSWQFSAPGGESFEALCDRALDFLEGLSAPSVIVTHGITSRILRGLWLGQGWDEMAAMPGGQGCVYHLADGAMKTIPQPG